MGDAKVEPHLIPREYIRKGEKYIEDEQGKFDKLIESGVHVGWSIRRAGAAIILITEVAQTVQAKFKKALDERDVEMGGEAIGDARLVKQAPAIPTAAAPKKKRKVKK